MLWQETDRTFTGTIVCFINIGRNNPIPAKFTKINAQRVPTASRLSIIFPTISGQMTFCAMLTHVSRLNFNVRPLQMVRFECVCVCGFSCSVIITGSHIWCAPISPIPRISHDPKKMKRENEKNRQWAPGERKNQKKQHGNEIGKKIKIKRKENQRRNNKNKRFL